MPNISLVDACKMLRLKKKTRKFDGNYEYKGQILIAIVSFENEKLIHNANILKGGKIKVD